MGNMNWTIRNLLDAPFDINCYIDIYAVPAGGTWHEGYKVAELFNHVPMTWCFDALTDDMLDCTIRYVTTDGDRIVIEI